jgi:hypothetical protein
LTHTVQAAIKRVKTNKNAELIFAFRWAPLEGEREGMRG